MGRSGDDFDGVAVGVGDGGEVGAGGGVSRLAEDGHAGGLQTLDEGVDVGLAAGGEGHVDVAVCALARCSGFLHQLDACASFGRVHEYDACTGRACDFRFGLHAEVCAVESA